jgi:hypothetical protein
VALQPKTGQAASFLRFIDHTQLHTHTHARAVGLFWTSDELIAEAATYTTRNKQMSRIPMPSAGFEAAIATIKLPQTYTLDRTITGIGISVTYRGRILNRIVGCVTCISQGKLHSFCCKFLRSPGSVGVPDSIERYCMAYSRFVG